MASLSKELFYTCDRCHGRVRPGDNACPHCWQKFTSSVPVDPSGFTGVSKKLPRPRRTWLMDNIYAMILFMPVLLFFDLLCFSVSRLTSDNSRIAASGMRLRMIGAATLAYEADHGNRFPPTDTTAHLETALAPYIDLNRSLDETLPQTFEQPDEGPYLLNKSISGSTVTPNTDMSQIVIAEEIEDHREGGRMQLFADGNIHWTRTSVKRTHHG